jgi:predicted RecB family nuclease
VNPRLSKSKIISGIQCLKRLWLEVHRSDLLKYDQSILARMDTGHKVGEIAYKFLAPGGIYIGLENGFAHALEATRKHLESDSPIYEATFAFDQVLVRSDIVIPSGSGLKVIEVKSSTQVKEYHIWDCAIQFRVLQGTGYAVQEMQVAVIDSSFVYPGEGNYQGLLRTEDVTKVVLEMQPQVESWVGQCLNTVQGSMPSIEVGDHCSSPFDCPFLDFCMPSDWPEYPLNCLPGISSQLRDKLKQEGFEDIRDIPQGRLSSLYHERVRRVTVSGKAELLPQAAKILDTLAYPRYFLDFETAQFAIPIWEGTRPYEQLPFQWSCHVQDAPDQLRHLEFLDLSGQPPMRRFAESLLSACGESGPIIVYGSFERTIIRGLTQGYPDLANSLQSLSERIVDLLPIIRHNYYHPKMCGSWSLKAVQPCLVPDLSYTNLGEVQEGGQAQEAYAEAISPDTTPERKRELRRGLLAYCEMDTLALVRIVDAVNEGISF